MKSKKTKDNRRKSDGRRIKFSGFFITVNTNKKFDRANDDLDKWDEKFQKAICKLFSSIDNYKNILQINKNKNKKYINDTFSKDYIKSIKLNDWSTEIGPNEHRLHAHIVLSIRHFTLIHINVGFVTEFFKKILELPGLYINVRTFTNAKMSLIDYINKDSKKTNAE